MILVLYPVGSLSKSLCYSDRNNNEKDRESFDEDLHDRCKNIIIPLLVSQTSKDFVIGLKALSCLLQANPKVGHMIINEEKILARVVEIAVVHPFPENEFAAEVLALASSDTTVRNAVAEGGYTEIFLDLLEAKDDVVKSHAGIALAKLAPVDTAIGELLLKKNRHLRAMMSIISSFVNLKPIPSEISKPVQLALEAIAYLSIYVETKKALAVENNGMWFKSILKLTDLNDRSMNYGIAQITSNLTTNVDDMKAEYESEIEQLKQVASKGLNINRERDVIKSRAGSPDEIATVRAQIVECGVVRALFNAFHQPNGQSEGIQKMSENVQMAVARTLLRLSSQGNGELRGKLVQQRALRLLVDLFQSKSERCRNDSALALARIAISTNPNLYPTGVAEDICLPILKLLKDATHELHQFECLLALTNLASMNEMIRERLWNADAWYTLRMMLTSENWKVQVAALECQVNMIMCEKAVAKLASPSGNQDIQIFLAFARSGDLQGMTAACGALAMISHDEEIAKKMIKFGGLEQLQLTAKCGIPELEARAKVAVENLEIIDLSKIVITPEEAAEIASIHQRMMDAISSPAKDEEDDDE